MSEDPALHCWQCGASLAHVPRPLSRHEFCRACGEALHCCQQCVWFDVRAAGQCGEARAEPPTDKSTANFCEWFGPAARGGARRGDAAQAARARLDALFGAPDDQAPD